MLSLRLDCRRLKVICLGAHSDDIEIGCGGLLLRWLGEFEQLELTWVVLSAEGERADEAHRSARALMAGAARLDIVLGDLPDAHFPAEFSRAKSFLQAIRERGDHDVVFTHHGGDMHQDHRLVSELTWQTWRNHLIAEYEIPKYEGDLGRPNLYAPLPETVADRKVGHLMEHFASQRNKDWFSVEAFRSLMRLRGIECRAPSGWAEAFHLRKAVV